MICLRSGSKIKVLIQEFSENEKWIFFQFYFLMNYCTSVKKIWHTHHMILSLLYVIFDGDPDLMQIFHY